MLSALWASLESIPLALKLIQQLVDSFQLYQLSKIDLEYTSRDKQRKALLEILKTKEVSNEQRMALVRTLYDLNHSSN